jgi:hypothetical protein
LHGNHTLNHTGRNGHHGDDAASVLGTVQGAALRSARAYARPSGLDGACVQMIDGQLRDGRPMLSVRNTRRTGSIHWKAFEERRVCSTVSGHVRFTRWLRFIFRNF